MPYIGGVEIDSITSESLKESTQTTDHELEDGEQITDHANNDPIEISIDGVIIDSSDQKLLKLREIRESKTIVSYNYQSRLERMLITSFNPVKSKDIKDGYTFSMTLKQIRLVKAPNVVRVSSGVKKQVKAVTNVGKKNVKTVQKAPAKRVTSKAR